MLRKIVTHLAENKVAHETITSQAVNQYLGRPRYLGNAEIVKRTAIPGVATGLAWTSAGGEVLFVEATRMPGGKGFQITGSIGNVMQESAKAALSYVRSKAEHLKTDPGFFEKEDIHLHAHRLANQRRPSARVTMALPWFRCVQPPIPVL